MNGLIAWHVPPHAVHPATPVPRSHEQTLHPPGTGAHTLFTGQSELVPHADAAGTPWLAPPAAAHVSQLLTHVPRHAEEQPRVPVSGSHAHSRVQFPPAKNALHVWDLAQSELPRQKQSWGESSAPGAQKVGVVAAKPAHKSVPQRASMRRRAPE